MKRILVIVLSALLLGVGAYFICFRVETRSMRQVASLPNEIAWLSAEFKLSPEQSQRIARLHAEYKPRCMAMCRKIADNNARLDRLIAERREFAPEMETLLRESAEIQTECRKEMLAHIYAVAAEMPPDQNARYIELLKNQIIQPGVPFSIAGTHAHD
jgi:Heavy-metal resistance